MKISIIAGVAQNNVIGNKGELPWHISEDLKRFKELTMGKPVIMGRKTYESIIKALGKPLPGRTNIVVSRSLESGRKNDEVIIVDSVENAIKKAEEFGDKAFVIGGQNIYEQTLDLADGLEITHIHKEFKGDAYFPKIDGKKWRMVLREDKKTKDGEIKYSFLTYERDLNESKEVKGKGFFIAFEGIDGCGKSTQIRKLLHHIFEKDKHHNIILTRNPYQNPDIRKILTEDSDPKAQAEKLADLFINDRIKQTEEIISPNLKKGHFVLSDRYKMSSIAYQTAQGLEMQDLIERQKELPRPDMTFIVDVSAEVARERMKKEDVSVRGEENKFEGSLDFAKQLRENYHKAKEILESQGYNIFMIDGQKTPEEVFSQIKEIFDKEYERINRTRYANVLFYDDDGNILLQDREGISKWDEEYAFFGGHIEKGESSEEAVEREIKEELGIKLEGHRLFKYWPHFSTISKCNVETYVFLAKMPSLHSLNAIEGKVKVMKLTDAFNLKMVPGYNELLREIYDKVFEK